jgi:hypothetical protein
VGVKPLFYIGLHMVTHAPQFDRCMISVNRLRLRKSDFNPHDWMMDSGAFTEISTHGEYRTSVQEYADQINRWKVCGNLLAAVSQDYMCESFILAKTGLTVADHQRLTIERYDALLQLTDVYILPVLQGYKPEEYVSHIAQYDDRLKLGMWVGVGSVCKRNSSPAQIEAVLTAIRRVRPDLRLHGFGLKITSLKSDIVSQYLYSCDSMAWSFAGRKDHRANDPTLAHEYAKTVDTMPVQGNLYVRVDPVENILTTGPDL